MNDIDKVRENALKIINSVINNKSYSNIKLQYLDNNITQLDKAFITDLVYGTIKWKLSIDYFISKISNVKLSKIDKNILNILRMGIYQIEYMNKVPAFAAINESVKLSKKYGRIGSDKFVNAILRNYIRSREDIKYNDRNNIVLYLSLNYSYPEWIIEKLLSQFSADFVEDFLINSNKVPSLTIRINKLKIGKEELKKILQNKGININEPLYIEEALSLKGIPGISNMDEYKKGFFTVQDEASMLVAKILNPSENDFIMDVCSAPGTKSTHIAELMNNKGHIISCDINEAKLKLVSQNAKRLGIDIIDTKYMDASKINDEYLNKADKVLVDAPCSGFGIMRKKPEIRWNKDSKDIENIKKVQTEILNASSKYVKIGGSIIYSTCTVLKDENIDVIQNFLNKNKNFIINDLSNVFPGNSHKSSGLNGYIELYPNIDGCDGFFISSMKRVK